MTTKPELLNVYEESSQDTIDEVISVALGNGKQFNYIMSLILKIQFLGYFRLTYNFASDLSFEKNLVLRPRNEPHWRARGGCLWPSEGRSGWTTSDYLFYMRRTMYK